MKTIGKVFLIAGVILILICGSALDSESVLPIIGCGVGLCFLLTAEVIAGLII